MSEQDNEQVPALQRPTIHDPEAWKVYWEAQGLTWRTEPEIDTEYISLPSTALIISSLLTKS